MAIPVRRTLVHPKEHQKHPEETHFEEPHALDHVDHQRSIQPEKTTTMRRTLSRLLALISRQRKRIEKVELLDQRNRIPQQHFEQILERQVGQAHKRKISQPRKPSRQQGLRDSGSWRLTLPQAVWVLGIAVHRKLRVHLLDQRAKLIEDNLRRSVRNSLPGLAAQDVKVREEKPVKELRAWVAALATWMVRLICILLTELTNIRCIHHSVCNGGGSR
jgi:hypothetical protein